MKLAEVLAELYSDDESARRIARTAGVDLTRVAFNAKAANTWSSLLNEADSQGKLAEVVRLAMQEYPSHQPLFDAMWYMQVPPTRRPDGYMTPNYTITPPPNESETAVITRLATQLEYLTIEVKRVSDGLGAIRGLNVERIERGLEDVAFMRGRLTTLSYAVAIVTVLTVLLGAAFLMHL